MRPSNANNFEGSEDVNNLQDDQNYSDDHNPLNGRPPANRMNTQTGFQMPLATENHSKCWEKKPGKIMRMLWWLLHIRFL